jgi:hypothetical protein
LFQKTNSFFLNLFLSTKNAQIELIEATSCVLFRRRWVVESHFKWIIIPYIIPPLYLSVLQLQLLLDCRFIVFKWETNWKEIHWICFFFFYFFLTHSFTLSLCTSFIEWATSNIAMHYSDIIKKSKIERRKCNLFVECFLCIQKEKTSRGKIFIAQQDLYSNVCLER